MAETLTMESNVETTSIDNLSEEEKDSLQVGEKMEQAQEQLLAGKYKNAEELEKGYLELQQKLSNKEEAPQEEAQEEEESEANDDAGQDLNATAKLADFKVANDGSRKELEEILEELWESLPRPA